MRYNQSRQAPAPALHLFGRIVVIVANIALVAITLRRMTLLSLRSDQPRTLPATADTEPR